MVVHFSSSAKNIDKRIETLKDLTKCIVDCGHKLSRDWLSEAQNASKGNHSDIERWKRISQQTLKALRSSDVVIIEASIDSFSMGFQTALALELKKPLLILRSRNGSSLKYLVDVYGENKPVEQSLLAGDTSPLKMVEVYENTEQAKSIIEKFLEENDIDKTDMRFNMFLDRESYQYLERVASETGKTKAKIIREILKEKNRKE